MESTEGAAPLSKRGRCWLCKFSKIENVVLVPALLDTVLATLFWSWSIVNVVTDSELGGVGTFLLPISFGGVGIAAVVRKGRRNQVRLALAYAIGVVIAHTTMTVNYAVASFVYSDSTSIMYAIFGASFWLVTGGLYGFWARTYYLHCRDLAAAGQKLDLEDAAVGYNSL